MHYFKYRVNVYTLICGACWVRYDHGWYGFMMRPGGAISRFLDYGKRNVRGTSRNVIHGCYTRGTLGTPFMASILIVTMMLGFVSFFSTLMADDRAFMAAGVSSVIFLIAIEASNVLMRVTMSPVSVL